MTGVSKGLHKGGRASHPFLKESKSVEALKVALRPLGGSQPLCEADFPHLWHKAHLPGSSRAENITRTPHCPAPP